MLIDREIETDAGAQLRKKEEHRKSWQIYCRERTRKKTLFRVPSRTRTEMHGSRLPVNKRPRWRLPGLFTKTPAIIDDVLSARQPWKMQDRDMETVKEVAQGTCGDMAGRRVCHLCLMREAFHRSCSSLSWLLAILQDDKRKRLMRYHWC